MIKVSSFILLLSMIFIACNKDAVVIDDNLNINDLDLQTIDSFTISTKTILNPAVDGKNHSFAILGQIDENRFGKSKASFYTEFSLTKNAFDIGNNPVLDSVVLVLNQTNSYGSLENETEINVYELTQNLSNDIVYNNNVVLNVVGNTLATIPSFKFKKGATSLRIPLKNSFGSNLLDVFETNVMENSDNFKAFFKGLYVTVATTNGDGFVYLNLKNDKTKIELYYHSDTETNASYSYTVNSSDIAINQYVNNGLGGEASFASTNSNNQEFAYISSMSGYRTLLEFPDLTSLKNVIINKAELVIYQADYGNTESTSFSEPNQLFLLQNIQDTTVNFLPDFNIKNQDPFGGKNKLVEINGENTKAYTFHITKYVQSLVNESAASKKLYLTDRSNNEGNRLKIGGSQHTNFPIELNIVYTKLAD